VVIVGDRLMIFSTVMHMQWANSKVIYAHFCCVMPCHWLSGCKCFRTNWCCHLKVSKYNFFSFILGCL